ncbi:MAG: NPCBM/NEW2 domain-containing protein [Kiritimatiellia bacterium]
MEVEIKLKGAQQLLLIASDAGDGKDFDHADWGEARITATTGAAPVIAAYRKKAVILTRPRPPRRAAISRPAMSSGPGHPFLYRVPCGR